MSFVKLLTYVGRGSAVRSGVKKRSRRGGQVFSAKREVNTSGVIDKKRGVKKLGFKFQLFFIDRYS